APANARLARQQISLAALPQQDSRDLVLEILRKVDDLPPALLDLITTRAEGNPFFIEELIKMLIEQQVILKDGERWRVDLTQLADVQIPSTLVEVLQARLDSLSPEERVLMQRAAVVGRVFWDAAVSAMEKEPAELANLEGAQKGASQIGDQTRIAPQLAEIIHNLGAKEMVFARPESSFAETQEYYFKHALLRDVTYNNVLKRLRKVYHAYAAAWLEAISEQSRRSGEYAGLIAEHYHRADDHAHARAWYQRAGELAADTYANSEAVRCLTHCLELTPADDPVGKFALLLRRAKVYDTLANRPAQKADLEALTALAEQLDAGAPVEAGAHAAYSYRALIYLQWWFYHDQMGDSQAAMAAARQAKDLAAAAGDLESEALAYLYLGGSLWRRSEFPQAEVVLNKSMALARSLQLPNLEADSLRQLGIAHQYQGDFSAARQAYESAILVYNTTGNDKGQSMALNSLGSLAVDQGLYQEGLAYYQRSLELKRKIGHRYGEHITLFNMGALADRMGSYLEAIGYLEKVEQFGLETGSKEEEADALNGLGGVYLHLGDYATAGACLERALILGRELDNESTVWDALQGLGILAHLQGDDASAERLGQEALALARKHNLALMETNSLFNLGLAVLALGHTGEALEHFQHALELAQADTDPRPRIEIQAGLAEVRLAETRLAEARLAEARLAG
ncbi:MAG TPA: tetratricopeptide repeat protein, partial [Anaerolineales bacterium]|nr:tetratricopeptide repeat protein [Anaerolineales bacterium]